MPTLSFRKSALRRVLRLTSIAGALFVVRTAALYVAASVLLITFVSIPGRATTIIDNTSGIDASTGIGINTHIPYVGEVLTIPATDAYLSNITIDIDCNCSTAAGSGGSPLPVGTPVLFDAFIAAWDGAKPIGPVLWSGSDVFDNTQIYPGLNIGQIAFAPALGPLPPGAQFIFYIEVPDAVAGVWVSLTPDHTGGDEAVFDDIDGTWHSGLGATVASVETFQSSVPEPTSLALLASGLIGLLFMARRRRA